MHHKQVNSCGDSGSVLADIFRGKRILAVITSSPYQLFVLVCIFSQNANRTFESCDLLVPSSMPNADLLASQAKESGLFNRVVELEMPYDGSGHLLREYLIACHMGKRKLKDSLQQSVDMESCGNYEVFMYPSYTPHVLDAHACLAESAINVVYDEGSGTYDGLIFSTYLCGDRIAEMGSILSVFRTSNLKDAVARLLVGKRGRLNPSALLVFRPELVVEWLASSLQVARIPLPQEASRFEFLFPPNINYDAVSTARLIYLTLSDDSSKEMHQWEEEILANILKAMPEGVLVKLHPGRSDSEKFVRMGCNLLSREIPWEILIASRALGEDCIIAGIFSSAQLTPNIVFGLKPRLLFCYELTGMSETKKNVARETIHGLEASYGEAGLISVPYEWKDLSECLG